MNRGLLVFSILVIVVGLFTGIYFVPLFGVFLLFIALLAPTSSPRPPRPQPPMQEEQRHGEPTKMSYQTPSPAASTLSEAYPQTGPAPMPMGPQVQSGYEQRAAAGSPPLFPTTMFPSFTQSQPSMAQVVEERIEARKEQGHVESRDELLELVALLAVVRLISS